MKVFMQPQPQADASNGILQVVRAYHRYLPAHGVTFVADPQAADVVVGHAGNPATAHVAMLHGLNWSADYALGANAYLENAQVVGALRQARAVTVPSEWVAETLRRDMHLDPFIVGHGITLAEWPDTPRVPDPYVLWNKNRADEICSPADMQTLAALVPGQSFVSTYGIRTPNVRVIGNQSFPAMRTLVQRANVYLATTKETFGIGTLEALASGAPVLGYAWGGTAELVRHKETGYLVPPGDVEGLRAGLAYCLKHRARLSAAARESARAYSWERMAEQVYRIWSGAAEPVPPTVAVVIPCYNKDITIVGAIHSVLAQTHACSCVVVDDGSTDHSASIVRTALRELPAERAELRIVPHGGVAAARNAGWHAAAATRAKYVCFLDADDQLNREFIAVCVQALERDPGLAVAYTGLGFIDAAGQLIRSGGWPGPFDYDQQLRHDNQVPTCCVMRRTLLERTGGYRSAYCPQGAGSEDAELWLRAGALGFAMAQVDRRPLFHYRPGGGTVQPDYHEPDWAVGHPWVSDRQHPFASLAKPARFSHPVRQYDRPAVSVVIDGRIADSDDVAALEALTRTCDSLEAQTFRQWEAIHPATYYEHLPFLRPHGPRAPLQVHIQMGDWMQPDALAGLVATMREGCYTYVDHHLWRDYG